MQLFADLLDASLLPPSRNGKLRLIEDYLRHAPDPDRGYALAALTRRAGFPEPKPAALRDLDDGARRPRAVRLVATTLSATSPRPSR